MELQHYGVLGMKWGVRKSPEQIGRERAKMQAIAKRGPTAARQSDVRLAKKASTPIAKRTAQIAGNRIAGALIGHLLSGEWSKLKDPAYAAKTAAKIAGSTAFDVTVERALAKSMAQNYTEKGRLMPGVKDRLITKQDAIHLAIKSAPRTARTIALVGGMKMSQINKKRAVNEAAYNNFARNNRILEAPISGLGEFMFSGEYDIYDKPR